MHSAEIHLVSFDVLVWIDTVARGAPALQTTNLWLCVGKCLPHHWQSVDTLQNLRWKEMQLRLWKILAYSPGGKSTLTNIELYIWSVINSTWNGGPRWQSRTPVLLIAPAEPVNKYFPFSRSLSLALSLTLSSSPTKVSGGGGSFDYLRCRLIAFLNLCTDVLLHRPGAHRTCPDGPLPGGKTNHTKLLSPYLLPITDLHPFISP